MQAGGAERVMAQLCNHLGKTGHSVTLITLSPASETSFYEVSGVVRQHPLGRAAEGSGLARIIRVGGWIKALRRTIAKLQPDVVISFVDLTNVMVLLATRGLNVPVIVSERIDPAAHAYRLSWLDRMLRSLTYPHAARIVIQTRRAAKFFKKTPVGKIVIIPNPVPPASTNARVDRASTGGRFRIIGIGRLDLQKGFDILIDSFASLADRFPNWDVAIFGQGPDRGALLHRIALHGLENRIELKGVSSDVASEAARSHLMAFPSRYEGFPNALAEAMAVGLPVVAFEDVSGVEDLVVSGESGILVRLDQALSENPFAEALAQLMTDPELRIEMGEAARIGVERFHPETVLGQWDRLLAVVARRS